MTIWFTSDLHLGHANIIKFCDRPFKDVHHMNCALTANWNAVVRPNDLVYVLGDFTFKGKDATTYLQRLSGTKILIAGNHDKQPHVSHGWQEVVPHLSRKFITLDNQGVVLDHYAGLVWYKSCHGAWLLFGHSHGTCLGAGMSMDVGVDANNYTPVSWDGIKRHMATLKLIKCKNTDDVHEKDDKDEW